MRYIDVTDSKIRYDVNNLDLTDKYSFDDCKRVVFRGGSYSGKSHGIDYLWLTPENKIKAYRAQYDYDYTAYPYWETFHIYWGNKSDIIKRLREDGIIVTKQAENLIKEYCW